MLRDKLIKNCSLLERTAIDGRDTAGTSEGKLGQLEDCAGGAGGGGEGCSKAKTKGRSNLSELYLVPPNKVSKEMSRINAHSPSPDGTIGCPRPGLCRVT